MATQNTINANSPQRNDPFNGFNFIVTWNGLTVAGFKQCSGLDSTTASSKYREGADASLVQREIPGLSSFSNISLQRGITTEMDLWDWRKEVMDGTINRQNLTITLQDNNRKNQRSWHIFNAWPTKWTGPSFDATSDAIAIETLELAHEGIEAV
jgi:phage tail-like protein